jgi:hypothetical protein
MGNYVDEVEGKYFTDLSKDIDFQKDLVRFFSGSRYSMSIDEIKELGPQGLAEKFAEHMRWQSTNEVTALKDYNYVQNKEVVPEDELASFGSLMLAFDKSEGGGTGTLSGAWDYMSAFATSPSTIATVGTGGWGVGSKLAAKASGKAAQLALRKEIVDLVRKGVSKKAIQDTIAGTIKGGALKGAVTSAMAEGALGAGQAALQGETREVAAGVNYGMDQLLYDGLIAGTVGGVLGGATRAFDTKQQRSVVESIIKRDATSSARKEAADKAASVTLAATNKDVVSAATDRAVTIANTLSVRDTSVRLDPLDPELVKRGDLLKSEVLVGKVDREVTSSLSLNSLRSITATTIEIAEKLKVGPQERISSAVSSALRDGTIDSQYLNGLRDKYNLSKEQLSYIFLADLSQAGKTLAEASYISKTVDREAAKTAAANTFSTVSSDLAELTQQGISTISDKEAAETVAGVYSNKDGVMSKIYKGLQATDSVRIAFMTSQIGTTAANAASSVGNLVIDISDQFWKSMVGTAFGVKAADKVQRRWVGGALSTIKGLSWGKADARLFKEIFLEERPEEYSRLFYEATRAEVASEGTTAAAKASRAVNILNSAVDSVFKQATLYSSVDRSLRELNDPALGKTLGEFLSKNKALDALPEDFLKKAVDDSRRFTFQRSYSQDKSAFGQIAQTVINTHQKLPFVVSASLGIPFPRYIANHLEHINDYTPLGIITGGLSKLDTTLYKDVSLVGDAFKTGTDRTARQITGASLIMLGAYTAAQKNGEIDYDKIKTETDVLDISRTAGPWLMNFYLGDLYYRWKNDLPMGKVPETIKEISLGTTDLGFNDDVVVSLSDSIGKGEITPELARVLGDVGATYTYPLTFARDFLGQINPEKITTPYTKEVFGGDTENPSMYGETNYLDDMVRRSTRFLPEVSFLQYAQSYNGKTAIPYYSPFSEGPIGSWNPLSKQLGFTASRKPNELQKELSRLNIKEYEVYTNQSVPNPAIDVVVREVLSKSLPEKFFAWKSQVKHGGAYAERTYDEITNPEQRTLLLKTFLADEIKGTSAFVEGAYTNFLETNPKAASGYVRNMYVLKEKELAKQSNDDAIYDTAVKTFTQGNFGSAADYLGDSEDIYEELTRRQAIMDWSSKLIGGFTPFPKVRN